MDHVFTTGCGLVLTAAGLVAVWSARRPNNKPDVEVRAHTSNGELLPVLSAEELYALTASGGLLSSIRSKCGYSAEHFDRTVMPALNAYAEFVQQLPAVDSHYGARPSGLLTSSLEMADLALTFRRGQILPKGAAPEDIMRLEHRWTYAVLVAALMHDIGRHMAALRVMLYRDGSLSGERWLPLSGTMAECGATRYCMEFLTKDERATAPAATLAVLLYQRLIPADALAWLAGDGELIGELIGVLADKNDAGSGAIRELVLRATAASSMRDPSAGFGVPDCRVRYDDVSENPDPPAAAAPRCEPLASESATEEFLEDVEDSTEQHAVKPGGSRMPPGAPSRLLPAPVVLPSPAPTQSAASAPPEGALRFMAWLKAGLAQGTLRFNELGAMVHFVKEGMLLVSPKIFQHFASVAGEQGTTPAPTAVRDRKDLAMDIQRQLLKADWHVRSEKGNNIVPYHVLRGGKPGASIFGVVIAQPDRFVYPIPPATQHLVSADSSIEA